jgi:hypothetical protein
MAEKQVSREIDLFETILINIFDRLVRTNANETEFYIRKVRNDSSFKGAIFSTLVKTIYFNQFETKENQSVACKEKVMTIPVVIYAQKDFYLLESMNEKIKMLITAGLIEYWNFEGINKQRISQKNEKNPKILTLYHVSGCFYILVFDWLLSLIFFPSHLLLLGSLQLFLLFIYIFVCTFLQHLKMLRSRLPEQIAS